MTIAPGKPNTTMATDPRELISPEVFEKITLFIAKKREVTLTYAERMFGQTLIYLKAYADTRHEMAEAMRLPDGKGYRVVPDMSVDAGWHDFLQHTEDHTAFCERIAGAFIHHRPVVTEEMRNGVAMERTLAALHATGYRVDMEFWTNSTSCCPPDCASVFDL